MVAVDEVDNHIALHRNTVGAVGVVEEGHFKAADVGYEWHHRVAVGFVGISADVGYAVVVKGADGAPEPFVAAVEDVVVGVEEEIESCFFEGRDVGVGRAEHRVA